VNTAFLQTEIELTGKLQGNSIFRNFDLDSKMLYCVNITTSRCHKLFNFSQVWR